VKQRRSSVLAAYENVRLRVRCFCLKSTGPRAGYVRYCLSAREGRLRCSEESAEFWRRRNQARVACLLHTKPPPIRTRAPGWVRAWCCRTLQPALSAGQDHATATPTGLCALARTFRFGAAPLRETTRRRGLRHNDQRASTLARALGRLATASNNFLALACKFHKPARDPRRRRAAQAAEGNSRSNASTASVCIVGSTCE
jgi:hypothetical protein